MVMIVRPETYRNKTELRKAVENEEQVVIEDPSIFNPRVFTIQEMQVGEEIVVTNHPKRSYFVKITRKIDGSFKAV